MRVCYRYLVAVLLLMFTAGCIGNKPFSFHTTPTPKNVLIPTPYSTSEHTTESVFTDTPPAAAQLFITPLPSPSLPPEDASGEVLKRLKGDSACRFPCFWGLVPGRTSISETTTFLDRFGSMGALHFSDNMGSMHIKTPIREGVRLGVNINLAAQMEKLDRLAIGFALEKEHLPRTHSLHKHIADGFV